jgi:hypothetical protein
VKEVLYCVSETLKRDEVGIWKGSGKAFPDRTDLPKAIHHASETLIA